MNRLRWLAAAKNLRQTGCFGSLQGKKSPVRRFFEVLCAKRDKLLVLLTVIFCSGLAAAPGTESEPPVGYDDFTLLSVEEQMETALRLYCSGLAAWRSPVPPDYGSDDFNIGMNYITIIDESGETEKIKAITFERLSGLDPIDFTETDIFGFFRYFFKNHITADEELMLYRKKLREQLTHYKLINYHAVRMNESIEAIEYLTGGKDPHIYTGEDGWSGEIYVYNKYTALGFEDLHYDEHLVEGYRRLSAERQIRHIWNEWQASSYRSPLSTMLIHKIKMLMERREETIPWLYNFLRTTREEESEGGRSGFLITCSLLDILLKDELLNDSEKRELSGIYRQKLDEYIRHYGKVTGAMVNRYITINYLDTGIWIEDKKEKEGIADMLKAAYKELGYDVY